MDKKAVAAVLEEIALLLELTGENPFKIRAYESGARAVLTLPGDLAEAVRGGGLAQVKGVGKSLAAIIADLVERGDTPLLQELRGKVPAGLLELLQVPGLGPKKAKILYDRLQIASLGELEYAIQENRLLGLAGFGPRTQERLKAGLEQVKRYEGLFRLGELLPAARTVLDRLRGQPGVVRAELAGGVRRGLEVDDAIVLVAALAEPQAGSAALGQLFPDGGAGSEESGRLEARLPQGLKCSLWTAAIEGFGAAWLWATGSRAHLEGLQGLAAGAGLALSQQGLSSEGRILPAPAEEDLYRRLGLPFIPPELREGHGELEAARQGRLPRLIHPEAVRGCFHVHSHYSDGVNSLPDLVAAARQRGWEFLGLSDHSQSAYYAGGLKPPDLERQQAEVAACCRALPDFRLFWGIESDISADGALDYPEATLREFDFVIASVHSQFRQPREVMTQRILRALADRHCTMLGHVTGRLLLAREPYEVDLEAILAFAGQHQVIMEVNASPYRLDLDWRWLRRAKELGVLISLNPDAHSLEGLDDVYYGVTVARKGWLEAGDVLNTYSAPEVALLLKRRRAGYN